MEFCTLRKCCKLASAMPSAGRLEAVPQSDGTTPAEDVLMFFLALMFCSKPQSHLQEIRQRLGQQSVDMDWVLGLSVNSLLKTLE